MPRPTKHEAVIIAKRNEEILIMDEKGYPLDYITSYYGITKGRVVQILKEMKQKKVEQKIVKRAVS